MAKANVKKPAKPGKYPVTYKDKGEFGEFEEPGWDRYPGSPKMMHHLIAAKKIKIKPYG